MSKIVTNFVCNSCGSVYPKWSGKCDACNEWGTITEELSDKKFTKLKAVKSSSGKSSGDLIEFSELSASPKNEYRFDTKVSELNRVLGGGLVLGSAVLIGGDPGIGKSTILLQLLANLANNGQNVIYITGEESVDQVSMRARRLGLEQAKIKIASATNINDIISTIKKTPTDILVIDSIQTMYLEEIESTPGTVSQVRSSAHELISFAKNNKVSLILVGHVTKDGQIAGPKVLEHMVDTVLYFEGDRGDHYRIIRAVKNRFGAANEIGVFEMTGQGLQEVTNPSALFISGKAGEVSGSVVFAGIEGTRPLLVEIQALVSPSPMANPRRAVVGWDTNRLSMILAVLQTRCGFKLFDKEVYLNVAGGIKITEPAADLAVAAAIVSALTNLPIMSEGVIFGEIGLSGEVRPVSQAELRLKEAEKLGFKSALIPNDVKSVPANIAVQKIKYLSDLKNLV
jgi:DNA repair protein RadA/Sms